MNSVCEQSRETDRAAAAAAERGKPREPVRLPDRAAGQQGPELQRQRRAGPFPVPDLPGQRSRSRPVPFPVPVPVGSRSDGRSEEHIYSNLRELALHESAANSLPPLNTSPSQSLHSPEPTHNTSNKTGLSNSLLTPQTNDHQLPPRNPKSPSNPSSNNSNSHKTTTSTSTSNSTTTTNSNSKSVDPSGSRSSTSQQQQSSSVCRSQSVKAAAAETASEPLVQSLPAAAAAAVQSVKRAVGPAAATRTVRFPIVTQLRVTPFALLT